MAASHLAGNDSRGKLVGCTQQTGPLARTSPAPVALTPLVLDEVARSLTAAGLTLPVPQRAQRLLDVPGRVEAQIVVDDLAVR